MKTHDGVPLGGWVRRFLLEHLIVERNLSRNTQRSYRDTLRLLIPFAADHHRTAVDRLVVTELSADLVRNFLRHIEERRGRGVRTRNQRLAAIHALATFVGERCPELIPGAVRSAPYHSNAMIDRACAISTSPRLTRCWPRRIARPSKAVAITPFCCSSTTPEPVPARLRLSPSAISTFGPMGPAQCGSSAREAKRDIVRCGRRP
jgi:Phage integrase, N-terminal SAM-like domain